MKRGRAERIVGEVGAAVARWATFAEEAGVDEVQARQIEHAHRLDLPSS
jgi:hypothetical protein